MNQIKWNIRPNQYQIRQTKTFQVQNQRSRHWQELYRPFADNTKPQTGKNQAAPRPQQRWSVPNQQNTQARKSVKAVCKRKNP